MLFRSLSRLALDAAVTDDADGHLDRFLAAAAAAGVRLRHLERERASLEELYLEIAGGPPPP